MPRKTSTLLMMGILLLTFHHQNGLRLHLALKCNKVLTGKFTEVQQYQIFYMDSFYDIVLEKLVMIVIFITVMNIKLHLHVLW